MMNDKNDSMQGIVAPTDSRWRHDMRLYEEKEAKEIEDEESKKS